MSETWSLPLGGSGRRRRKKGSLVKLSPLKSHGDRVSSRGRAGGEGIRSLPVTAAISPGSSRTAWPRAEHRGLHPAWDTGGVTAPGAPLPKISP